MYTLTRSSSVLWVLLMVPTGLASGCHEPPPTDARWELAFSTPDSEVVLVSASAQDLFSPILQPLVQRTVQTGAECHHAWYDPCSGRLATVEQGPTSNVVRVYAREGTLLAELLPEDAASDQRAFVCLSKGGDRVAYVDRSGIVSLWDLGREAERKSCRLGMRSGCARPRCLWQDGATLVAVCRRSVYAVDTDTLEVRFIYNAHLAGIVNQELVLVGPWFGKRIRVRHAETGEEYGSALTKHSYSNFVGLSPCGEYMAYHEPRLFGAGRFIHHLASGSRVRLKVPNQWRLGSWQELPETTGRGHAGQSGAQ